MKARTVTRSGLYSSFDLRLAAHEPWLPGEALRKAQMHLPHTCARSDRSGLIHHSRATFGGMLHIPWHTFAMLAASELVAKALSDCGEIRIKLSCTYHPVPQTSIASSPGKNGRKGREREGGRAQRCTARLCAAHNGPCLCGSRTLEAYARVRQSHAGKHATKDLITLFSNHLIFCLGACLVVPPFVDQSFRFNAFPLQDLVPLQSQFLLKSHRKYSVVMIMKIFSQVRLSCRTAERPL